MAASMAMPHNGRGQVGLGTSMDALMVARSCARVDEGGQGVGVDDRAGVASAGPSRQRPSRRGLSRPSSAPARGGRMEATP